MKLLSLLLIVVTLCVCLVDAKKMWGSRKRHDELEEKEMTPPKSQIKPTKRASTTKSRKFTPVDEDEDVFNAENVWLYFSKYLSMFEEVLNSDDFGNYFNPEQIKQAIEQFPGASESPEVAAMIAVLDNADTETLRSMMREGIDTVKNSADDILAVINDPEKVEELINLLPKEFRDIAKALQTGDISALKDFVMNMPGLGRSQKKMLMGLLDGNTELFSQELKKTLSDDTQIEAARQQVMEYPELAQAFGISAETLNDPTLWAEMMASRADALFSQLDSAETERAVKSSLKSKFSGLAGSSSGDGIEADEVEDFLKRFKSKLGRAA